MNPFRRIAGRLLLSRAKHRSFQGHPRVALRLARWIRSYSYSGHSFFAGDAAPSEIERKRREAFERLSLTFKQRFRKTLALSEELESGLSDLAFINTHRVPFQYQEYVSAHLKTGSVVEETNGCRVRDLDGNWSYDLSGSYGVNLFGSEFYKECIARGVERAGCLGLILGPYHPIVAENVIHLKQISGLDAISFHMSGTEAVMQAVRLARYHTRRSHIVRFAGAYHGWWDGVQVGIGNPRPPREIYTLREMSEDTLRALRTRNDIACVLVNPAQAIAPNEPPATDSALVASDRSASFDKCAYTRWLKELREVCTTRSIVLIFDEVFVGFRLARGGAQEYFGVAADMVTYGKSLGGGLPLGVLCGKSNLMRRSNTARPLDMCFARGTFNSHPYVMTTMNEFLCHLDKAEVRSMYERLDDVWNRRAQELNSTLAELNLPVRVANLTSIWTAVYTEPSRYNWMFQYYLREQGLMLSWIGTGRFIFSHDLDQADFNDIANRFVAAARSMHVDGWWWKDATLTNSSIKRRVLKEVLNASLGRAPSDPAIVPSEEISEPCGTSSRRETGPSESW